MTSNRLPSSLSRRLATAIALVLASLATPAAAQEPAAGPPPAGLPFSDARRAGDLLFVSGAIGVRPGTMELVADGIQAETRQTLENIAAVLARHGATMAEVVKCTVMLDEISEWAAMNEVYVTFFADPKPARSALGADGLALGAKVEIECIAWSPEGPAGSAGETAGDDGSASGAAPVTVPAPAELGEEQALL